MLNRSSGPKYGPGTKVTIDSFIGDDDPAEFFRNGYDILILDGFKDYVFSNAGRMESFDPTTLRSFDLLKHLYDREIICGDSDWIFDESEVCAFIEQMIRKHRRGVEGDLLSDGNVTLFYLRNCVVDIHYWRTRSGSEPARWVINAWPRDCKQKKPGTRVFSRR